MFDCFLKYLTVYLSSGANWEVMGIWPAPEEHGIYDFREKQQTVEKWAMTLVVDRSVAGGKKLFVMYL